LPENFSTRETIVVAGLRASRSSSEQTSTPKIRLSTSGEPPERKKLESQERWYGASNEGVGAA
jgi:hypothetical protein